MADNRFLKGKIALLLGIKETVGGLSVHDFTCEFELYSLFDIGFFCHSLLYIPTCDWCTGILQPPCVLSALESQTYIVVEKMKKEKFLSAIKYKNQLLSALFPVRKSIP